jgi:hypothetical protein
MINLIKVIFKLGFHTFIDIKSVINPLKNVNYFKQFFFTVRFRFVGLGIYITKNERELRSFKNRHKGQRCFIIGNGPSLNKVDLNQLNKEITFGVNGIYLNYNKMGFYPTYYVIEDYLIAEDRSEEINALEQSFKFIPSYLDYTLKKNESSLNFNAFINYRDEPFEPIFSKNCARRIGVGGSVTYMCLQLAYYMGFQQIYLIGFDHNYPKLSHEGESSVITNLGKDENHFTPDYYRNGERLHDPNVLRMEKGFETAKSFLAQNGIEVFNVTPGGHLEVFVRMKFEEVFKKE